MPDQDALHAGQERAGARFTPIGGESTPFDFGDVDGEYDALRRGAGLLDLSFRAKLRFTGADRVAFLQNMLTNDIQSLQPGRGCRALKLTVQGKMEAALHVLCFDTEIGCDLEPAPVQTLVLGLRRRILRDDVQIEDVSASWKLFSVQGPAAGGALAALGIDASRQHESLAHAEAQLAGVDVRVVRTDHAGAGGFDIWVPSTAAARVWEVIHAAAAVRPVGLAALDIRRIEAGIPWHGKEITTDHFPQEAGLEDGWISYTKGCYLGQETIARIHHMGHVNRCLRGLILEAESPPPPRSRLVSAGREVGEVTSSALLPRLARPVALAYIRSEHALAGTQLVVVSGSERWPCGVRVLPLQV